MLTFVFVKALMIQLISSKHCSSKNDKKSYVFSCTGCTGVIDCALNITGDDVTWARSGKPNFMHDQRLQVVGKPNFKLEISDIIKADEDKYCCYGIYRHISKQYCTLLEIVELQVLPNNYIIVGTNNSNVTVSCSIKNNIPGSKIISWIKNGEILSWSESNILNLTFLLTTEIYKQNITCKADLDCINMSLERDVQFSVNYAPRVKVTALPSSELNERDSISLTCSYESIPYPSLVKWLKNNNTISHFAEYKKHNISREENGLYVCNVSNTIGYGVAKVQISVLFAPEVKVEQLQNGSLLCNATGIPNKYTFLKWEHRTANGYFLRSIDSKGKSLLAVNINSDEPIYTKDGQYQCTVSNGVPDEKNITVQNGNSDVNFPGKPHCFSKHDDPLIWKRNDTATIAFDVYSINITHYEWWNGTTNLNQTAEYQYIAKQSITSVFMYGGWVNLNTTTITLKISNKTDSHFDTLYTLYIYNQHGHSNCSMTLLEGRVPAKPEKFKVVPLKGSFKVTWLPGNSGHFQQRFIIKYRSLQAENWTTVEHLLNTGRQTVQGLSENMNYTVYMFARNIIGNSDETDTVTITTLQIITTSTREVYSATLSAYIATCFCCVVILLLASVFYIRLREFAFKVQKKTRIDNSKQRKYCQQKHWSVYEEVILNPAQNGKRFIINTIPIDDDLNTSG